MRTLRVEENVPVKITVERGAGSPHRIKIARRIVDNGVPGPWETVVFTEIGNGAANKLQLDLAGTTKPAEFEFDPEYFWGDTDGSAEWNKSHLKKEQLHNGGRDTELVYEDQNKGDDYFDLLIWMFRKF